MAAYFVAKGLTVPEIPTARPSAPDAVLEWRAEWRDYAKSAGLADDADVNNIAAGGSPRTPLLSLTSID